MGKGKTKDKKIQQKSSPGGVDFLDDDKLMKAVAKVDKMKDSGRKAKLEAKLQKILTARLTAPPSSKAQKAKSQPATDDSMAPKYLWKPTGKREVAAVSGGGLPQEELMKRQRRMNRFVSDESNSSENDSVLVQASGVGTCEALEKEYLRLTSLPTASTVRPPHILEMALKLVKAKWLENQDYKKTCEQLKSIRQDLTVQKIRDRLSVDAYETHGRIALEHGDASEFWQCHAVLKQLYKEKIPGGNPEEFQSYGILHMLGGPKCSAYLLGPELKEAEGSVQHPYVAHALDVARSFRTGNCYVFMSLYSTAPRMSPYLMDRLLPRIRGWALQATACAYRPTSVPLSLLAQNLGMDDEEEVASFVEEQAVKKYPGVDLHKILIADESGGMMMSTKEYPQK